MKWNLIFHLFLLCHQPTMQTQEWIEAGVVFIPDTTVFVASTFKTVRVFVPFPELPRLNLTTLRNAREALKNDLTENWGSVYDHQICQSPEITTNYFNLTASAIGELEQEYLRLQQDYTLFKSRMTGFSRNDTKVPEAGLTKNKRQAAKYLIAAAAALIIGPHLEEIGCKVFSVFGICKTEEAANVEVLHQELSRQRRDIEWLNTATGKAVRVLSGEELATRTRVETVKNVTDRNMDLLVERVNDMAGDWEVMRREGCRISLSYRYGLSTNLKIENLLQVMSELHSQVLFSRAVVTNLGYVLSDALVSLTKGLIPATLLPPPKIKELVMKLEETGWYPTIGTGEMSAYYEFDLVKNAQVTEKGLHIELEVPFHHTYARYQVYRTVAIPHPIGNGTTATLYEFTKEYLVVSPRREFFGELDRSELVKCHGTDRLRFCRNPFALTRTAESTCLGSLFFDHPSDAFKMCPQKVVALPPNPTAEYLAQSNFLLTSRNPEYQLLNFTNSKQSNKIQGCRVCIVQPPCNGRLEHTKGGLVLYPEPGQCEEQFGKVAHVKLPTLLDGIFRQMDTQLVIAPEAQREQIKADVFHSVKLTLNHLPPTKLNGHELRGLAQPFIDHQAMQYQDYSSKLVNHGVVPFGSFILLLILIAMGLAFACYYWRLFEWLRWRNFHYVRERMQNERAKDDIKNEQESAVEPHEGRLEEFRL